MFRYIHWTLKHIIILESLSIYWKLYYFYLISSAPFLHAKMRLAIDDSMHNCQDNVSSTVF